MNQKTLPVLGKTLIAIEGCVGDRDMYMVFEDNTVIHMHHYQDCCETVEINDIAGDLSDLIGSPLLMAEEVTSREDQDVKFIDQSFTWTFYKFATVKGYVTIRWLGTSNGYYSERVDCHTLSPTEVALFKMGYRYSGDWTKREGESFARYNPSCSTWEGWNRFEQKQEHKIEFRDEEQFISEVVDAECAHFYP